MEVASPSSERDDTGDKLVEKLEEHRAYIEDEGVLSERRRRNLANEVVALATFRLRHELEASMAVDPEVHRLLDAVVERKLDPASAAKQILASRAARAAGE